MRHFSKPEILDSLGQFSVYNHNCMFEANLSQRYGGIKQNPICSRASL